MSWRRRLLAYGFVGCALAGLSWLWVVLNEKHIERSVTERHSTDRWGM